MKNLTYCIVAFLLTLGIASMMQGCTKAALDALPGTLLVSHTTIKVNQPDSMLLKGAPATDSIRWSVIPSEHSSLITKSNAGLIWFSKPGTYIVSVSDNGATPVTASITVTAAESPTPTVTGDTSQHTPITWSVIPLTGDQITLVPYFHNSATADSSYLTFVAQTKNYYCGTSTLHISSSLVNNNYSIGFLDVAQPSPCAIGNSPIAGVINFTHGATQLPTGTFPLSVTLNGTTYTGSIISTLTTISFSWNYTTGVLISPKQISR
jgi:hypothetical protein